MKVLTRNRRIQVINYKIIIISFVCLFVSIYIYYSIFQYLFVKNHFDPIDGTEGKLCPACFGNKACPDFFRGEINIIGIYRLPFLQKFRHRQIYEAFKGLYEAQKLVILKKLATNRERANVDQYICSSTHYKNLNNKCIPRDALWDLIQSHPTKTLHISHVERIKYTSPMMHCVTDRLFKLVTSKFKERTSPVESVMLVQEGIMILYNLYLNQHSLMLQLFPAIQGYPFPKYLGSCGRWLIEEHVGKSIDQFCSEPFWKKVKIVKNILDIPKKLIPTHKNFNKFALYIGDNEIENYVINPNTLDVRIVDLEHMLVVDIAELEKLQMDGYDEVFQTPKNPCGVAVSESNYWNCTTAVQRDKLCGKLKSDHNIHAVCALLLQNEVKTCLLDNTRFDDVKKLLVECVNGDISRFEIIEQLHKLLDSLTLTKSHNDSL